MDNNLYGILYSLNSKLNKNDVGSIDFILAQFFIKNFNNMPDLNIYQIAEDCSVSRASIRRFAKSLGFENFADMKENVKKYLSPNISIPDKNYRELLTGNLIRIANELDERMNTHEIDVICNRIRESRRLFIYVSKASISNANDFQIELASKGKVSYIISDISPKQPIIQEINEDDYIITLSVSGVFAQNIIKINNKSKCMNDLITVNRIDDFSGYFTHVYYMSHLDHSTSPDIYRAYGLRYFLDIIQNHYK